MGWMDPVRTWDEDGMGCKSVQQERPPLSPSASHSVLTLRAPGTRAVVGDMVELRCEAQSGSFPIRYRFYLEDVILGSSSAPSGRGVSFNLSLTAEHSGNYSCEADNGLGAQCSEAVTLSVTGGTCLCVLEDMGWSCQASFLLDDSVVGKLVFSSWALLCTGHNRPHPNPGLMLPRERG
ncbi:Fc receptor-like protein 2 [Mustela putorius furo]|uniref:Fc receptor-like protein 2 n=1 Tax=Mustela putorius furo TaxID=9669 RepID=A0A8U0SGR5_MUSPF|nr:Fc receptor-like protein 2 [Mustela putorius furo]